MKLHRLSRAFTLIEILVVVSIIAVVMSIAVLSLGVLGDDRDLREEGRRVVALVQVAQDEAVMQGREFGIEFMTGGFRFVEFDWWREKEEVNKELAMTDHKRLEYLSDEFVDVLAHACSVAERYGFKLSINMCMGWPPGGTWITEEYRTRKLKSNVTIVEGPSQVGIDVKVSVPMKSRVFAWRLVDEEKKLVQADSFLDLTDRVIFEGEEERFSWNAPQGKWLVVVFTMG